MKRGFEEEFKELKLNETPDLWNRIEAALPEKRAAASASGHAYVTVKRTSLKKWGLLAAAVLCVVLILPAVSFVIGNSKRNSGETAFPDKQLQSGAADISEEINMTDKTEASNTAGTANVTDTSQNNDMTNVSETNVENKMTEMSETPEKERVAESAGYDYSMAPAGAAAEKAENEADADASSGISAAAAAEDSIMGASRDYAIEDGQVLHGVVVKIEKTVIAADGETSYEAFVKQADEDGVLSVGDKISLAADSGASSKTMDLSENKDMEAGESYILSIKYEKYGSGSNKEKTSDNDVASDINVKNDRFVIISSEIY